MKWIIITFLLASVTWSDDSQATMDSATLNEIARTAPEKPVEFVPDDLLKARAKYLEMIAENKATEAKAVERVKESYLKAFDRHTKAVQAKGDLTAVLTLQKREKELQASFDLVAIDPGSGRYIAQVERAQAIRSKADASDTERYRDWLKRKVTEYTRKGKIKVAKIYRDELNELKSKSPAKLYITADNSYKVWVDGNLIGSGKDWKSLDCYDVNLSEGSIVAIEAIDKIVKGKKSAGLYCTIVKNRKSVSTSSEWNCSSSKQQSGWEIDMSLVNPSSCSEENIHDTHKGRQFSFKSEIGVIPTGSFIWSTGADKIIYVKYIFKSSDLK